MRTVEGTGGGRHQTRNPQGPEVLALKIGLIRLIPNDFLKMVLHRLRDAYWSMIIIILYIYIIVQFIQFAKSTNRLGFNISSKFWVWLLPGQCSGGCGASALGGVCPPGDQQRGGLQRGSESKFTVLAFVGRAVASKCRVSLFPDSLDSSEALWTLWRECSGKLRAWMFAPKLYISLTRLNLLLNASQVSGVAKLYDFTRNVVVKIATLFWSSISVQFQKLKWVTTSGRCWRRIWSLSKVHTFVP